MFADRLSILRTNKKLTHQDMADRLGITRQAYGNYESGKREPDYETLQKLADLFNVSLDYLLGRDQAHDENKGFAFYGGGSDLTEEEKEIAEAAANAAIDAYRKGKKKGNEGN
ncbi:helix-turn-helix domain-containing protein [Paenibacillus gansuensis]|uniref:Helix-turn-helix domain-containing protein n=1 Tax=Paenibacillus gansuensis TaxID=306542 RepID=A0ABW5PHG3_9BACL